MKTIAIVDTMWVGHHSTYFKLICRSFLEKGWVVVALCPRVAEVEEWALENLSPEYCPRLRCFPMPELWEMRTGWGSVRGVAKATLSAATRWLVLRGVLERIKDSDGLVADFIFFPKIDGWIAGLPWNWAKRLVVPVKWGGVYFHPLHCRGGETKPRFSERLVKNMGLFSPDRSLGCSACRAVGLLDENLVERFVRRFRKPIFAFPDITDESPVQKSLPLAQEIAERARGRSVIGLLGGLDERKGLRTCIELARRNQQKNWLFVFAGSVNYGGANKTLHGLKNSADFLLPNCYYHLERLEDGVEFNSVANACDILYAVYNDFPFSSNILTKAAMLRKPVLVSKGALLEERVRKYGTGLAVDPKDIDAIENALANLISQECGLKRDYDGYFEQHSIQRLGLVVREIIGDCPQ